MASASRRPLSVYRRGDVYLVPLGPGSDPNARGYLYRAGRLSTPMLLGSIAAHVGGNLDWEPVPDAEIPPALKARLATLPG